MIEKLKLERDVEEEFDGLYIQSTGMRAMPVSEMEEVLELCKTRYLVYYDGDIVGTKAEVCDLALSHLRQIKNIMSKWAV